MTIPTVVRSVTDEDVARAASATARHDLLEEILRAEPSRTATRSPGMRTATAVLGAAAAVVLVAGVAGLATGRLGPGSADRALSASTAAPVERALLDAPGWQLTDVSEGGAAYRGDGPTLTIEWLPRSVWPSYSADRAQLDRVGSLDVLGASSPVYEYGPHDHAVLRAPEGSRFMEIRGQGLDLPAFTELLTHLVPAPAVLPDATGDGAVDRDRAIGRWQEGLAMPSGVDYLDPHLPGLTTEQSAAVTVLRGFACGFVQDYAWATDADPADDQTTSATALAGLEQLAASPARDAAAPTTAPAEVDELLAGMRAGTPADQLLDRCGAIQGD